MLFLQNGNKEVRRPRNIVLLGDADRFYNTRSGEVCPHTPSLKYITRLNFGLGAS